jgi:GNAT superfamily N-acetyltransferase
MGATSALSGRESSVRLWGLGLEGIRDVMLRHPDLPDQFMARTLVSSVRLDGKTIGMLVMGPPSALYVKIMHRVTAPPERVERLHLGLTILLSKLDIVCIAAEHRGRGLGSRLVRQAVDVARKSMVRQIYGQFRTEKGLTPFYENLGFEVGNPGDTLSVSAGSEVEVFGKPTETLFSKALDSRPAHFRGSTGKP